MIVKGIVERATDRNDIKVRIPFLNGLASQVDSTPTDDLPNAALCQLPNANIKLEVGDIVWVNFENTRWESPVIVGFLNIEQKSQMSFIGDSTEISVSAKLPRDTQIGEVSAESIDCLRGLETNLHDYFQNNMQVFPLDLTAYDNGDTIPLSVIQSIPQDAYIIATTLSNSGTVRYWNLAEKSEVSQGTVNTSDYPQQPQYDYLFYSPFGYLKIIGRKMTVE